MLEIGGKSGMIAWYNLIVLLVAVPGAVVSALVIYDRFKQRKHD